jgi:hypothetical protein
LLRQEDKDSIMKMKAALLLLGASGLATRAQAKTVKASNVTVETRACQPGANSYGFCDTTKSVAERAANLISLLKDSEIVPQLTARHQGGGNPGPLSNISRLGIPDHDWVRGCRSAEVGMWCWRRAQLRDDAMRSRGVKRAQVDAPAARALTTWPCGNGSAVLQPLSACPRVRGVGGARGGSVW